MGTGDGPWGSSPKGEKSPDPLPRGVFNGEMFVASAGFFARASSSELLP